MEGRLPGPSGTHLADSLKAIYLAFCSHSRLNKQTEQIRRTNQQREFIILSLLLLLLLLILILILIYLF